MKTIKNFIKKEAMLTVSIAAAVISLFITPPSRELFTSIDWKTLATLFMLLSVLDGFKHENLFQPLIKLTKRINTVTGLSFFLIFGVFLSSMFVTNDVSLIIFVPLTIILFRSGNNENFILPVIVMENIAAVRGSLLTPFGSPQNLFLYSKSGQSTGAFMRMMLPLWIVSAVLLTLFIFVLHRKNIKAPTGVKNYDPGEWNRAGRTKRTVYFSLFAVVIASIVTRTAFWPYITAFVILTLLIFDREVFKRVDYALLLTFFCFFIFSSSIASNPVVSGFLQKEVTGREYICSILISQVISNVPAAIVLWPFTSDIKPLIYGLDTAGLISVIGSLASVINMRIYLREYPGNGKKFMIEFEKISLAFFAVVAIPQWLLCKF